MSNKVYGQSKWSMDDLFRTADFFGVEITDLLPRRVPLPATHEETPQPYGEGQGVVVAGAGFEPTTSGL